MARKQKVVQRRCDSCGVWLENPPEKCPECRDYVDHYHREEKYKAIHKEAVEKEKQAEFEAKPALVRGLIKTGRLIKTIFIAIVTFFASLIFWLGG